VVSLKECNARIFAICAIIILVAIIALFFNVFSGFFFVNSIAKPVREVSAAARKIASGDYKEEVKTDRLDEIGELCDSINYMQAELKSAEQLKNDFISSVSHELRTPLTAIRGWAETSKMSVGYDEELVLRGLDVVLSESDRLADLVEELLDFSRMQSGRMTITMMPITVTDILKEAVDMYVELAAKREIDISFTAPKIQSVVNGDKNRLKQVFINIIDNAVKYTGEKGQVLIEEETADGCVKIVVKDTGVGIPAADIDHVKEKFYKANKEVRGSGIGLAVADEIIKQMDGLLFLESTEGIGTTVTVVLPLYIIEEEPTETVLTPEGEEVAEEGANNG
jgi:signal transduction histidine kinase